LRTIINIKFMRKLFINPFWKNLKHGHRLHLKLNIQNALFMSSVSLPVSYASVFSAVTGISRWEWDDFTGRHCWTSPIAR